MSKAKELLKINEVADDDALLREAKKSLLLAWGSVGGILKKSTKGPNFDFADKMQDKIGKVADEIDTYLKKL